MVGEKLARTRQLNPFLPAYVDINYVNNTRNFSPSGSFSSVVEREIADLQVACSNQAGSSCFASLFHELACHDA